MKPFLGMVQLSLFNAVFTALQHRAICAHLDFKASFYKEETETKDLTEKSRPHQIVAARCSEDNLGKKSFTKQR